MKTFSSDRLQEAVACIVPDVKVRIEQRALGYPEEHRLWNEMACCILSSQVPYEMAVVAAQRLDTTGVLHRSTVHEGQTIEAKVQQALLCPFEINGASRRYRFPNTRATQLAATWCAVHNQHGTLSQLLAYHRYPADTRAWLVTHAPGIGPKQASMFLRNVGASYDMAVIDRHISHYMVAIGLCDTMPSDLSRLFTYEGHENRLRRYAENLGYSVGILDWAIWIVMKVATALEIV